jgi:hypothetical protein
MSALPPKADIGTQPWNVRFVQKADITRSESIISSMDVLFCFVAACLSLYRREPAFVELMARSKGMYENGGPLPYRITLETLSHSPATERTPAMVYSTP